MADKKPKKIKKPTRPRVADYDAIESAEELGVRFSHRDKMQLLKR